MRHNRIKKSLKSVGISQLKNNLVMNKKEYLMFMECYDEISDVLTDVLESCWSDPSLWNDLANGRMLLLKSKAIVEKLSDKIVKQGPMLP